MMKAIVAHKESDADKIAIRNRILKLKKEESRALARIRENNKK